MRASFLGYNVFLTRLTAYAARGAPRRPCRRTLRDFSGDSGPFDPRHRSQPVCRAHGRHRRIRGISWVPCSGAAFYVVFQDSLARLTDHWFIWMGILFIVVVLYFENGLVSLFKRGEAPGPHRLAGRQGEMKTVLRIENLFKGFSGLQVLSGVTMDIREKERHVVIGPNGAGKTTLFNIITGLHRPDQEGYTSSIRTSQAMVRTGLRGWAWPVRFRSSTFFPK